MAGPKNPKRGPQSFVTDRNRPKAKPKKPKKVETPEERKQRALGIRGSPLGLSIEESVRRRVKNAQVAE